MEVAHAFARAHRCGRRTFVGVGAGSLAAAAPARAANPSAAALVSRGMQLFRAGKVEDSVSAFDSALALAPEQRPYLWQRGLSLYYTEDFEAGAAQFRADVAVNPADVEESLWFFLCIAKLEGAEEARSRMLRVAVDRDPRAVLRTAYAVYAGDAEVGALVEAGDNSGPAGAFYASLYEGLWREATGDAAGAEAALRRAVKTPYAERASGDYMTALARVHVSRRGWDH